MNGRRVSTLLLLSVPLTTSLLRSQEQEDPVFQNPVAVGGGSWEITADVLRATNRGLAYLAKRQESNGAWLGDVGFKVNSAYNVTKEDATHVGVSALALMAFLANGELPGKGRYGTVVEKAVDYLVRCADETGYIWDHGTRMYSHAFATLALAEVYGMTERKDVRAALQRSVILISQSQNREGGWRYKPFAQESDMSITVCQVMALRAARNSGVFVPRTVIEDAVKYVRGSSRSRGSRRGFRPRYFPHRRGWRNDGVFRYQKRIDARASFSLTAAGVTTLYGAGVYEDPLIDRGLDYLENNLRDFNRTWISHYFFFYGNYYAVQAFYIAGGRRWDKYFREIREVLLNRQQKGGYWTCNTGPGRDFATAVAVLILSIPYEYLPIFQR